MGGNLAWARDPQGREQSMGEVIIQFQYNYDVNWQVWVYSDWQVSGACTVLVDYKVTHTDCNAILPFICERGKMTRECVPSCLLVDYFMLSVDRSST